MCQSCHKLREDRGQAGLPKVLYPLPQSVNLTESLAERGAVHSPDAKTDMQLIKLQDMASLRVFLDQGPDKLRALMDSQDVRDRLDVAAISYFAEARNLRLRKQNDYGATWQVLGLRGIFVHLLTKVQRLKQLVWHQTKQQVADESVRDTLIDLLNYSLISLYLLETANMEGAK
jgi:hypothetical protein